ncbi:interferon-related developmental regulator 2 isoform 2-T2 [Amazona ochrocephala]
MPRFRRARRRGPGSGRAGSPASEEETGSEVLSHCSSASEGGSPAEEPAGSDAAGEQAQEEEAEDRLKEHMDNLLDKSTKTRLAALQGLRLAFSSRTLSEFLLERRLTLTDSLEKCLKKGKGEEQALAGTVLTLLCLQMGSGPEGEEVFRSMKPLLVSVLTDSMASPGARQSCATALGMCCYIAAGDLEVTAECCLYPGGGHPGACCATNPQPAVPGQPGAELGKGHRDISDSPGPFREQHGAELGGSLPCRSGVSWVEEPPGAVGQGGSLLVPCCVASLWWQLCSNRQLSPLQDLGSCLSCLESIFSSPSTSEGSSAPSQHGPLYCSALQSWSLLLTICPPSHIKSILDNGWLRLPPLLASSNVALRILAGETIALIFELAQDMEEDLCHQDTAFLCAQLKVLATESNKYRAKTDRRKQRSIFRDILHFIESGEYQEEAIRFGLECMYLDSWACQRTYQAFKEVLGSGICHHLQNNELLREIFGLGPPLVLDAAALKASKVSRFEKHLYNSAAFKARTKARSRVRDKRADVL